MKKINNVKFYHSTKFHPKTLILDFQKNAMELVEPNNANDRKYYYLDDVIGVSNHPEDLEAKRSKSVLVRGDTCAYQYGF